jgi:hypothetical protein
MVSVNSDILQEILSNDIFKNFDKDQLLNKYANQPTIMNTSSINIQSNNIIEIIPPEGITINKSGSYTFANNILWKPSTNSTAITITASNVTLDMNTYYLKNCNAKQNNKTIVISIQNATNITISNGEIINANYYGIQAVSSAKITIMCMTINGLYLDDIYTRFLTPSGIFMNQCTDINIKDSMIENLNVTTDSCAGIQLFNCQDGVIVNCKVDKLINNDGAVQGYSYILSSNILTIKCNSNRLQSFFNGNILTTCHTVLGFCPIFCINLKYDECKATNQIGCCDDCHGISLFLDASIILRKFVAIDIIDGVAQSNSGAKSTGIEVYGINCTIDSCCVQNIKAINPQDKQAAGFSCSGYGNKFINCKAKNVIAVDQNGKTSKKIGLGVGFGWAPDPRSPFRYLYAVNTNYSECKSKKCQVGFDTFNHISSSWSNIKISECKKGFLIEPSSVRILSCNPCSECNPPINYIAVNVMSDNTYNNVIE